MKHFVIPHTLDSISLLGLGVNKTGNKSSNTPETEQNRISFYHEAMDLGVNFFDTAELYGGGYSEEILGRALDSTRRHDAFICTKFNARNSHRKLLTKSLEDSLKRLKTDYIDFYLAHWPNPNVPFEDLIESLEKFRSDGKIKYYGLSNATSHELKRFKRCNNNNFFVVENEYNLLDRDIEREILPFVKGENNLFLAYSPLIQGIPLKSNNKIIKLQEKYNCSIQQLYLAWVKQPNVLSLVRTTNKTHLKDNIRAMDITLSSEDRKVLENCFTPVKIEIEVDKIQIDQRSYTTQEEALENQNDLIPSPLLLSQRLNKGLTFPPLRVKKEGERYKIVNDFYMAEIKKYWAWRISFDNKKIEAYVFDDL
tara:strand:- start:689 stop:1789 length:1101 start_codon:yes stop_codon:yes gene_type:complete